MANWSGITASVSAILRPSILEPRLVVSSISNLDFLKFKQRGVVGVVIDKDNCITVPHRDQLAPSLEQSWQELLDTFGSDNVLIVSNSVGTLPKDPALLGAESVSRNLRVPVLAHAQPKPGPKCVRQIAVHFDHLSSAAAPSTSQIVYSPLAQSRRSLPTPTPVEPAAQSDSLKILVIGDRLATDLILSHRLSQLSLPLAASESRSLFARLLRRQRSSEQAQSHSAKRRRIEAVGILTTGLHEKEGLGTTFLRGIEKLALRRLRKKRAKLGIDWNSSQQWEQCLKGHEADFVSPRIQELPTEAAPNPSSIAPDDTRQRPRRFAPIFLALASSVTALPHTLPHFFRRLPHSILSSLRALPIGLLQLVRSSLRRSFDYSLEKLPVVASKLHRPMDRLVKIYTRPEELASSTPVVPRRTSTAMDDTQTGGRVGAMVERGIDRVEAIFDQARETALRKARAKST